MTAKIIKSCGDVYQDLGFSAAESEKLHLKTDLMLKIESFIQENQLNQEQAAKLMGVTRPRISDAIRGKIEKFTIDALVGMLARVGHHFEIKIKVAA